MSIGYHVYKIEDCILELIDMYRSLQLFEGCEKAAETVKEAIEEKFNGIEEVKGVKNIGSLYYYPDGLLAVMCKKDTISKCIGLSPYKSISDLEDKPKKTEPDIKIRFDDSVPEVLRDIIRYKYFDGKSIKKHSFIYASSNKPYMKINYSYGRSDEKRITFVEMINACLQTSISGYNQYGIGFDDIETNFNNFCKYFGDVFIVNNSYDSSKTLHYPLAFGRSYNKIGGIYKFMDNGKCCFNMIDYGNFDKIKIDQLLTTFYNSDRYYKQYYSSGGISIEDIAVGFDNDYLNDLKSMVITYDDFNLESIINNMDSELKEPIPCYLKVYHGIHSDKENDYVEYREFDENNYGTYSSRKVTREEKKNFVTDEYGTDYLKAGCDVVEKIQRFWKNQKESHENDKLYDYSLISSFIPCFRCGTCKYNISFEKGKCVEQCSIENSNLLNELNKIACNYYAKIFLKIYKMFENLDDTDFKNLLIKKKFYDPKVNFDSFINFDTNEGVEIEPF